MGCAYVRCIRPEQVDFKALWDFGTDGVYSWSGGCITTASPEMLVSDRSFCQLHVPVNFCQGIKGNRMWDLRTMFETTIADIVNCSCRCEYAFNSFVSYNWHLTISTSLRSTVNICCRIRGALGSFHNCSELSGYKYQGKRRLAIAEKRTDWPCLRTRCVIFLPLERASCLLMVRYIHPHRSPILCVRHTGSNLGDILLTWRWIIGQLQH